MNVIGELQALVTSFNLQIINITDKHDPEMQNIAERVKVPWLIDILREYKRKYRQC